VSALAVAAARSVAYAAARAAAARIHAPERGEGPEARTPTIPAGAARAARPEWSRARSATPAAAAMVPAALGPARQAAAMAIAAGGPRGPEAASSSAPASGGAHSHLIAVSPPTSPHPGWRLVLPRV